MAKRIEKLDNERWKGWDWAASNKLNEVIEAVNTLTERVMELEASAVMKEPAPWPTQVEPDSLLEEYKKLSERALEPDTEQDEGIYDLLNEWDAGDVSAVMFAEKIRNLLKGQNDGGKTND